MHAGVLAILAALSVAGVGTFAATTLAAPAPTGGAGLNGGGMMHGGYGPWAGGMGPGDCSCQGGAQCQGHMYDHNYSWDQS